MKLRTLLSIVAVFVLVVWSSMCSAPRAAGLMGSDAPRASRTVAVNASAVVSPSVQPIASQVPSPIQNVESVAGGVPLERPRQQERRQWVTDEEFLAALASSPWPMPRWPPVLAIAQCESPMNIDGQRVGIALTKVGLLGEEGPLQVLPTAHPDLARALDLQDLRENLIAGFIVYLEAGSFSPWSCAS